MPHAAPDLFAQRRRRVRRADRGGVLRFAEERTDHEGRYREEAAVEFHPVWIGKRGERTRAFAPVLIRWGREAPASPGDVAAFFGVPAPGFDGQIPAPMLEAWLEGGCAAVYPRPAPAFAEALSDA